MTESHLQRPSDRRLALNAFLLRPTVTPANSFALEIRQNASWYVWDGDHLGDIDIDSELLEASAPGDVIVAITDRPSTPPPWQAFIRDVLNVPGFGAAGRSLGAAVFCAVEDPLDRASRWVVYSFGSASHAVRRRAVEPRFGLMIALNRIAEAQAAEEDPRLRGLLRQASYRALGPYTYQAGYRAARDTPLDSFRMDRLADLLSAAGGRVGSADEPNQVFGARSLKTRDTVGAVDDLVALARSAIGDFRSTLYREDFSFVDHMVPVFDDALEEQLRQQIFEDVVALREDVDVLLPDDLVPFEDERSICYIVRPGEPARSASDMVLTVEMVAAMLRDHDVSALDRELRFSDADRNVIAHASVLDCLAADLLVGGCRYIAYDGDFFSVDAALLDRVNAAISDVPIVDIGLPCYEGGTEAMWNASVARRDPNRFILLDSRLVRLVGETPFEACDLVDTQGSLIHAKRKARSSSMSHLFVQAEKSCQLLIELDEARAQMRQEIVDSANKASTDPTAGVGVVDALADRGHGLSIILALLGDWQGRSLVNLPLLARLSLVTTVPSLRRLGFAPAVALVPLCSRGQSTARAG